MTRWRGARGLRPLFPRRAVQGRPLRRLVRHRRPDHEDLLPAELPGPAAVRARTCASTRPRRPRSRPGSARASAAGPTRRPARRSGTRGATSSARAMRLIADGIVDREGVTGLASRLGYSTRQLERHLVAEVGAGPLALARAQRAQTARLLIETTALPFAEIAFAAGFSSIRQFNDTVRLVFAGTPTSLRARANRGAPATPGGAHVPAAAADAVQPRQPLRPPGRDRGARMRGAPRRRVPPHAAAAGRQRHRGAHAGTRPRQLPPDARRGARPADRDRAVPAAARPRRRSRGCRHRALGRRDAPPARGQEPGPPDPAHGRRSRARGARRARPAGVDRGRAHPRGAARHRATATPIVDTAGGLTHVFPSVDDLAAIDPAGLGVPQRTAARLRRAGHRARRGHASRSTPAPTGTTRATRWPGSTALVRGRPR